MEEIWKDVVGFEGRYQVSNMGNVKSLRYGGRGGEKNMKPTLHHTGYKIVGLGSAKKIYGVHVLVAKAFVEKPNGKDFVNHIDGNKQNNCADNLEWVTARENIQHAIKVGLRDPHNVPKRYGDDNHASKPVYQFDICGNLIKIWGGHSEAARGVGCTSCSISHVVDKPGKTMKGFVWLSSADLFEHWRSDKKNRAARKREILQLSADGEIVRRWGDISEIESEGLFSVSGVKGCCKKDRKTHGGYVWRYAAD